MICMPKIFATLQCNNIQPKFISLSVIRTTKNQILIMPNYTLLLASKTKEKRPLATTENCNLYCYFCSPVVNNIQHTI